MRRLDVRILSTALAIAAAAGAGCGGSKPAPEKAPPPVAPATGAGGTSGLGSALVTTNEGERGPVSGAPDTGFLDELPQPSGVGAVRRRCASASVAPSSRNVGRVNAELLSLLNAERTARGLLPLKLDRKLTSAAIGHSRNMVALHYFAHDGADGSPFSRIRRAGYIPRAGRWTVGENLAYGTGVLASAAEIVKAWMNSPGHKANILTRAFHEIGIGTVPKPPMGPGPGATFTTTFGGIGR